MAEDKQKKKRALSLIQPSGELTIGNYLGALKNFSKLQEDYDCIFAVADMHSITVSQLPKDLRQRTKEVLAWYIATGIDPEKSIVFVQSQVPEHAELCWVLSSISYLGELGRMTQFKDKAKKHSDNLNLALYSYPVLMAADILLYQTDYVPVGEDQRQHLELTRDLADRFNKRYSDTFVLPQGLIDKKMGRIMSLKDPSSKMSKSDQDQNSFILMTDKEEDIRRKIRRAVTDSKASFAYSDDQPGLKNLINIYSSFSEKSPDSVVEEFKSSSYADFKEALADLIIESLTPIQERYSEILKDKDYLNKVSKEGAEKASYLARKTLTKVYRKVGFYQGK